MIYFDHESVSPSHRSVNDGVDMEIYEHTDPLRLVGFHWIVLISEGLGGGGERRREGERNTQSEVHIGGDDINFLARAKQSLVCTVHSTVDNPLARSLHYV